jgi:hypothetical protein
MKITSIRSFGIGNPISGGTYAEKRHLTERRPPCPRDAEVANPMSRYPRYKRLRQAGDREALGHDDAHHLALLAVEAIGKMSL